MELHNGGRVVTDFQTGGVRWLGSFEPTTVTYSQEFRSKQYLGFIEIYDA